jgi:hypothetical protein
MKFFGKGRVRGNVDSRFDSDYHPTAQPAPNASARVLGPRTGLNVRTFATFHFPIHEGLMAIQ